MLFPNADVVVNPALLSLLGLIVGTLIGFFGAGGFLITGGLLVLGVPAVFAVGTGVTLIMGSSIINALKHRGMGNVDLKLGALLVAGTLPAVFIGERLNSALESAGVVGPVIRYIYIVFLAGMGVFILHDYWRSRCVSNTRPGEISTARLAQRVQSLRIPPGSLWLPGLGRVRTYVSLSVSGIDRISVFVPVSVGFSVGLLAGLLGIGGGFILMPVLIFVLGIPTTVAIGTNLVLIIVNGSEGTFLYSLSNHVDPLMAVIMIGAASIGAQLGTAATKMVEASRIRALFGLTVMTGSVAVAMEQAAESGGGEFLSTLASVMLLGVAGAICVVIGAMLMAVRVLGPARRPGKGSGRGGVATETRSNEGDS